MQNHYIYSYIRNHRNDKIGIVVALNVRGVIQLGYSVLRKGDKFCRDLGLQIALARAEIGQTVFPKRTEDRIKFIINSAKRQKKFEGLEFPQLEDLFFTFNPIIEARKKDKFFKRLNNPTGGFFIGEVEVIGHHGSPA